MLLNANLRERKSHGCDQRNRERYFFLHYLSLGTMRDSHACIFFLLYGILCRMLWALFTIYYHRRVWEKLVDPTCGHYPTIADMAHCMILIWRARAFALMTLMNVLDIVDVLCVRHESARSWWRSERSHRLLTKYWVDGCLHLFEYFYCFVTHDYVRKHAFA